jgi:Kef-type K+ transport system membrane component KefB
LSSNISQLKQTVGLSLLVAFTGILCPIGISFAYLKYAYGYSAIEAFAAGASLCSTSMGTTFSVLKSANLSQSKVGTVLISAALIDDIVGLVIAGIIRLLASANATTSLGWTIARPLVASLCVIFIPLLFLRFVIAPFYLKWRCLVPDRYAHSLNLFVIVGTVSALTAISTYAGTSTLLGGFVAGMLLAYLDTQTNISTGQNSHQSTFDIYINPLHNSLLEPLFFASVGFAIPFFDLLNGKIAWRGVVFGILSLVTKALTGFWILLWSSFDQGSSRSDILELEQPTDQVDAQQSEIDGQNPSLQSPKPAKKLKFPDEHSLLASLLLGMSMIARGEVSLLIANIAYTTKGPLQQESFLVCIWAILICTVVGPVGVGILARKRHGRIMDGHWGKLAVHT